MFGINTYRKRKKLEIDIEMHEYRSKLMKDIEILALKCAEQKGDYEHDFHSNKEELGIMIAKIEASKESMTKDLDNLNKIINIKNEEIVRLNEICLKLGESKITIQN